MLLVDTIVNAIMAAAALVAFAMDAPTSLALSIFFAPLPTTFFYVASSGSQPRNPSDWSDLAKLGAALWLVAVLIVQQRVPAVRIEPPMETRPGRHMTEAAETIEPHADKRRFWWLLGNATV